MSDETTVGKTIQNCVDNGRMVETAIRTHAGRAATRLAAQTALSEEHWEATFTALADDIGEQSSELWDEEVGLATERADDVGIREERDRSTAELYELVLDTKDFLKGGRAGVSPRRVGLGGETPQTVMKLVAYASSAVESLRDEAATLTGPLGMSVDTAVIADKLDTKITATEAKIAELKVEQREAEAAMTDRDGRLAAWKTSYMTNATVAEGLFRRAGLDQLADRIRPSARRASGVEGPPADPADPVSPADDDVIVEPV